MQIIISPFAKKLREKIAPHPKEYPEIRRLVALLEKNGHHIIQIGGNGEEKLVEDCKFGLSSLALLNLIDKCDTWISIDSFLPHMIHYNYGDTKPGIVLFGTSDPEVFGYPENINLQRDKKYIRQNVFEPWEWVDAVPESFVSPEEVVEALNQLSYERLGITNQHSEAEERVN